MSWDFTFFFTQCRLTWTHQSEIKAIEFTCLYKYIQDRVYELKALHLLRTLTYSVFLKVSSIHPSTEVQMSATKIDRHVTMQN